MSLTNNKILDEATEQNLVNLIRKGDENAFKRVYYAYYAPLCSIAIRYLSSYDCGREIVQDLFLTIWERRSEWKPDNLKAYLYRSVCNRAINAVKELNYRNEALRKYQIEAASEIQIEQVDMEVRDLLKIVNNAISKLPKRRQLIFILHKSHGLTYKEIAEFLDISEKTVENQMGRAFKFLREELNSVEMTR